MTVELRLPNGAPAHYEWLSSVIYMDDTSPIGLHRLLELNLDPNNKTDVPPDIGRFLKSIGTLSRPKPWMSLQEAIADLSSRHEYCHYVQDVATGVGHWDELTFRSEFSGLASMYSNKQDWRGVEDVRSKLVDEKLEKFLVLVPPRIEERRKRERLSFLEKSGIATLSPSGEVRNFGMANLLEADSVAEVLIHASDTLTHGEPAAQLLFNDEVVHLWNPIKMPTGYRVLFDDLRAVMIPNGTGPYGDSPGGVIALLNCIAALLQQLTDIALAYPAPSFFNGVPERHRKYFDPVVKFYCLLSALHEIGAKAGEKMAESIQTSDSGFEDALLGGSRFRDIFPDRKEIYRGWEKEFKKLDEDDVILRVRKHGAEQRQGENVALRRIPMGSDLTGAGGLWWWNSRQLPVPAFSGDVKSMMDLKQTQVDLLSRIADVRILNLLCNGTVIFCPLAGKNCPGETPLCNDGFSDPKGFPTDRCMLRHRYGPLSQ